MPIEIRQAVPGDAAAIARLIDGLAEYEKLSHESTPDVNALAQHLHPDAVPRIECLLAIDTKNAEAVGFALFFPNYSTFLTRWGIYLEDLFVLPEHRGSGVGLRLLKAVAALGVERGCERLDWSVLNWNKLAIDFYRNLGARPMKDWQSMRLSGSALRKFAGGKPQAGDSD